MASSWGRYSSVVGSVSASAVCTSAVACPSARAELVKSACTARALRASCQPSAEPARYGWSTPSVTGSPSPGPGSVSNHAAGAGTRAHLARASASGSSRSGLRPGAVRRKTLRMYASPYTTEELDCSTATGRAGIPEEMVLSGTRRNRSPPSRPGTRSRSSRSAHSRASSRAS
ncbi:hypothetical protein SRIMM317S_06284 [Streptomyces rimosus subsp. rimosus]